jgi:hypothetical protein
MVPTPPGGTPKSAALEVVGDAMPWLGPSGALVYFENQHSPPTDDMIYYYVIAELEDRRLLFRRLLRGSRRGLFTLESPVGAPIEDVRIIWAAEPTAESPTPRAIGDGRPAQRRVGSPRRTGRWSSSRGRLGSNTPRPRRCVAARR